MHFGEDIQCGQRMVVVNVQVGVSIFVQDIGTSSVLHSCWLTVLFYPFDFLTT